MNTTFNQSKWRHILVFMFLIIGHNAFSQYAKIVAKDGSGDYLTVQAAIDAAPTGQTSPYRIFIKNGVYKEVIEVPSNKPFLQLIGESVGKTFITYDNYNGKTMPGGGSYGTSSSATVTIRATDFSAMNITFENTTGDTPQALAINVNNDRASFKNCRFLGGQDTLLANNNGLRQHYLNCYIDGTVDFIFGNARAVFDNCVLYPKDRKDRTANSYITAANTKSPEPYGFVFRNCKITANTGITKYYLGRPWQNDAATTTDKSQNKTVFLNTEMSSTVNPLGWAAWDAGTETGLITYAEFNSKNIDGSPLNISQRVAWSKQLNSSEAALYSDANLFQGWNPTAVFLDGANYEVPLIISNFEGIKGTTTTPFKWNLSWPISGVKYDVFRSSDNGTNFTLINTQTATDDNVNFNYTADNPPPGQTYQYYVVASKNGYISHQSEIITISSVPTVKIVGSLGNFLQGLGIPSAVQTYTVSAVDITNDVIITPPVGYEISNNGGATWYNENNSINLTPTNGVVSNTVIAVRLNANSVGPYSGNIIHLSTGAVMVNQAVNGTVQSEPLKISKTLITWELTTNAVDATSARAAGVLPTLPTFSNFVLANGSISGVNAFTTTYGQAFAPTAAGLWTPSPSNNSNRDYYEEFTIAPANNYSLNVDSILFTAGIYNSTGKIAVEYSLDGVNFTPVTGGVGPDGLATSLGAFTNPLVLNNQNTGNTKFKLALNNATGITVGSSQTLKIRLYFTCGSSSPGRYAVLKNVIVKGSDNNLLPLDLLSFKATLKNNISRQVDLIWKTTGEINTKNFEIERSTDGKVFQKIGEVVAKNLAGTFTYNFVDENPLNGLTYYRLKQIDLDASYNYSDVEVINNQGNIVFSVFPNPVTQILNVSHPISLKEAEIHIVDISGKKIRSQEITPGLFQTALEVSSLPEGIYFIHFSNKNGIITSKFIKQ